MARKKSAAKKAREAAAKQANELNDKPTSVDEPKVEEVEEIKKPAPAKFKMLVISSFYCLPFMQLKASCIWQ